MTAYFIQALIYLSAAVIAVPIAKKFGLGSVLGYLIAGVIIGPAIGLVGEETTAIQHFAEFGVVVMLFLVGLELEPKLLWGMRQRLLGLGGLQVSLTTFAFFFILLVFDMHWQTALAIGLILSLSSTAMVLQTLNEKGLEKSEGGRSSFLVLLFQDIAVIPILAIFPLLALPELIEHGSHAVEHHDDYSLLPYIPKGFYPIVVIGSIAGLIVGGHFLGRPLFRIIANTGLREMFIGAALLLIIGISVLMNLIGLSPALGAFIAGVVLANSEFSHELQMDLEPFKGLLLGLFFITVGAGINFDVITNNLVLVLGSAIGLMLIKVSVLYFVAGLFKIAGSERLLFSLCLAQAGEFGFVLLAYSSQQNVLSPEIAQLLSPIVAISMFLTPLLFIAFDKFSPHIKQEEPDAADMNEIDEEPLVVIAGIGRVGQIINRLLLANGFKTTLLDHSSNMINNLNRINFKTYYGDASRPDLLEAAGIGKAKIFMVSIDDRIRSTEIVKHVHHRYPQVKIIARAYDRSHWFELEGAGADIVISETYFSAIEMGTEALIGLGINRSKAESLKEIFISTEAESHDELFNAWLAGEEGNRFNSGFIEILKKREASLQDAMEEYQEVVKEAESKGELSNPA